MLGITALDIIRAVLITIAVMVSYNMGLKRGGGLKMSKYRVLYWQPLPEPPKDGDTK